MIRCPPSRGHVFSHVERWKSSGSVTHVNMDGARGRPAVRVNSPQHYSSAKSRRTQPWRSLRPAASQHICNCSESGASRLNRERSGSGKRSSSHCTSPLDPHQVCHKEACRMKNCSCCFPLAHAAGGGHAVDIFGLQWPCTASNITKFER